MRAIALISGGLDSVLAAKLMQQQGVEVLLINFRIPFCKSYSRAEEAAKNLNVELKSVDISIDFLKTINNPRYGFGANMNPCIDCKILMLSKCKSLMHELDAQFVITGEVLGQRPMSQHRQALETIAIRGGLEGLVLRPLSAKLLPETLAEKQGWVKREELLAMNGRTRRPQMELAKKFDILEYPTPAGGCLLTDPEFTRRLKELMSHGELNIDNIELLKVGRHFRISDSTKLIVGRNERENESVAKLAKENDYLFLPEEVAGPTALARGSLNHELINLSCRIICRYSDLNGSKESRVTYLRIPAKEQETLAISPLEEEKIVKLRV
ncbi:MAG: tRNA 4-thiouridine(8) synthase ThiI [Candidatus Omnitrophica bacterium]|nr:tRNA 4-thiouridine(8) synthase ThiI [Candidatus Omnitrophota bacterium]